MKQIIMNTAAGLALAGVCLLPVCWATAPALILPNGTIVNLDTGLAIEPDGVHYQLSHSAILTLELQQAAQRKAGLLNHPPHVTHKPIPHEPGSRS
ncbi:MAG: hypothetical protein ACYCS1_05785 [Gammaproteobacteria bacterium]